MLILHHMRALSTNILANHPAYQKLMSTYNELLKRDGKVNNKKFYEDIILAEIPEYTMTSWYHFLKRFKTEAGIVPISVPMASAPVAVGDVGAELKKTFLSNSEATQNSIAAALNLSATALQEIIDNPTLLSTEKRAELFLKVMKAQDSRVKAIGTIRADNRDQERFDRAMDSSAYG